MNAIVAPKYDVRNEFYQSDREDAERTLKWLAGGDMRFSPDWINAKKRIPAAWYAISTLAPQNGIECIRKHAYYSRLDQRWYAVVFAQKGYGGLSRIQSGASGWEDKRVALCFAYRNAIRQLLPMEVNSAERAAYRDTQDNAIRKYA